MYSSTNPRLPFYVANKINISFNQQRVLTKLFQPIVGATAIALYNTLANEFESVPIKSEYHMIYQLQEELDCKINDIFINLHKLEAIGLAKSFISENKILGQSLTIQLIDVPDATDFFKDFLVSSLLLEKVGKKHFNELTNAFNPRKFSGLDKMKEVTADFFDVFHLSDEKAINTPQEVQDAAKIVSEHKFNNKSNKLRQIDWRLLKSLLAMYHIAETEVDLNQSKIAEIITFYDLSEKKFVEETVKSLQPGQQKLDMYAIQNFINDDIGTNQTKQAVQKRLSKSSKNNIKLSTSETKLLNEAQALLPIEFLTRLKKKKGGFVSKQERLVIFRLQNQIGLTPELINILIWTSLQYDSVVTTTLANRLANNWLQNGVNNAPQAIEYVRKWQNSRKTKPRRNVYTEKATNWEEKKPSKKAKLSEQEINKIFSDFSENNKNK